MQGNTTKTKELNILYITMESAIFIERQKKRGAGGEGMLHHVRQRKSLFQEMVLTYFYSKINIS